ncbi:MAG: DUF2779 domain-containing protein [Cyclobacteriaceae bacterium]|nr:DUF2779 domain-containing protein [Cyclobacteriaceae bacterium]
MSHVLSKSTFMYGCQCPKRLYLHKHSRDLRNPDDEQQQAIFDRGTNIGELARQLFKYGVDASPPDNYSYHLAVAKTTALIARDVPIIYEAAFQYEGILCAVDILVKQGKHWYAFEVKSTLSVKEQHVQDAALQYYVMINCGLPLQDISIIYLDREYVRKGALDIKQLFTTTSVLTEVLDQQRVISNKVKVLKNVLTQPEPPAIAIGPHCFAPYGCDFSNHCWAHMPTENSVFEFNATTAWKLFDAGYHHLDQIPADYKLPPKATLQLTQARSGQVYIDAESIWQFLQPITYPLYFFDFETIMPGIPEFDTCTPYQQIPFQFSLHIKQHATAELEHIDFLGDGITDPRPDLLEAMLTHLGNTGSIICYNMNFEKGRITDLAKTYPAAATHLHALNPRVVDLMAPFQKQWYYHPEFHGRYSIKAVLPVLVPELRYDQLEIPNGSLASLVYANLKHQDAITSTLQRQALREYCKLDTLAMVKLYEVLKAV